MQVVEKYLAEAQDIPWFLWHLHLDDLFSPFQHLAGFRRENLRLSGGVKGKVVGMFMLNIFPSILLEKVDVDQQRNA